jgi:hypothetical protein
LSLRSSYGEMNGWPVMVGTSATCGPTPVSTACSSIPGVNDTKWYGPAPTGAFLNPSSPTRSRYYFGTIQAAPVAGVA